MISLSSVLSVAHLVGLALGVGAATAKLILLLKCKADYSFVPVYMKVAEPITRQIVVGLALLTLSGIGWLLLGYQFTSLLIVKVVLVGTIWVLGPVIDNVIEPKFPKLAPGPGQSASTAFIRIKKQYLALEVIATLLFYIIIVIWVRGLPASLGPETRGFDLDANRWPTPRMLHNNRLQLTALARRG